MSRPALGLDALLARVPGWPRLPLRLKLTFGYAAIFAATVLAGALGVYLFARVSLTGSLDATLRETADVARASVIRTPSGAAFTPALHPGGDLTIELLRPDGTRLSRVGLPEGGVASASGFASTRASRSYTEVLPAGTPGAGLLLRVSRPRDTLSALLEALGHILIGGSAFVIAVACAAGYALAARALRPVDAVARTAAAIARRGSSSERVPQAPGDDEMARLTGTVNAMLDRLEADALREKTFARLSAHELRTPITAMRGRLDLTLERERPAADYRRALEQVRGSAEALGALTEALLSLARTDAPLRLEPVELRAAALHAAEAAQELWPGPPVRVSLPADGLPNNGLPSDGLSRGACWVQAEPAGVAQVLGNLLANALKYGGGGALVSVEAGGFRVSSPGPGPDPAAWPRLIRPFERGEGRGGAARASGSGLGLALVHALCARWDAAVEPCWEKDEFSVRVRFPPVGVGENGAGPDSD